jgi:GNAT superfamily N-acetyltransferase
VQNVDMAAIPAPERPWDVIWSEGSAYILGVEKALADWRALLRPGGVLVFSDMVWRTDKPDDAVRAFWAAEYPAMATPATRVAQAKRAGYRVLGHFDIGPEGMETYYRPLAARLDALEPRLAGARVLDDLRREIAVFEAGRGQFGYEMFVLERADPAWHQRGSRHGLFNGLHHPRRGDCGALRVDLHASEGAEEGALIGALARRLIAETPAEDLRVFTAWEDGTLLGGIFFTRLTYAGDPRTVFMMAPVAVATAHQGKGIGQRLIAHGLDALRQEAWTSP